MVDITGFTLIRTDRTESSKNERGGGVCAYINNSWCKNIKVIEQYCDLNIKLLTLGLRPHYLPREITYIVATIIYVPTSANTQQGSEKLLNSINIIEDNDRNIVKIIMGDFNSLKMNSFLPLYQQFMKFPARNDKILDSFYCSIKES